MLLKVNILHKCKLSFKHRISSNKRVTKETDIANELKKFFTSIGLEFARKIPTASRKFESFFKEDRRSNASRIHITINEPQGTILYRNFWTQDASVGRWTLEAGLWILESGSWTLDARPWTLDAGC